MQLRSSGKIPRTPTKLYGGIRKEHPTPKRSQSLGLRKAGLSRPRVRELTGIPERTQRYQEQTGGSERRLKTNRGAKLAFTTQTLRKIIAYVSESFEHRQYS